jgi:hypothetical protein
MKPLSSYTDPQSSNRLSDKQCGNKLVNRLDVKHMQPKGNYRTLSVKITEE